MPSLLHALRLFPLEVLTRHGLRGDDIEHGLPGSEIRVGYRPKRRIWNHVRRGAVYESVLSFISELSTPRFAWGGTYLNPVVFFTPATMVEIARASTENRNSLPNIG